MNDRFVRLLKSDLGVLLILGLARVAFHTLTNGQYGFHRDELQTLDDARHLDWGFVAYPPITPLIARAELVLFGTSLVGFRFFATIAVAAAMVLAGLIAKELGGTRRSQVLAAVAVAISPMSLAQGAVLQYVSLDYLWGVAITYFLVRLLKTGDARFWIPVATLLGLGMETRYTMGFLALGIVGAVLLTSARRFLSSAWLWVGVALSIAIFLPNLIWQAQHHFISLDFLAHIHERDIRQGRTQGFLLLQPLLCINIATAPLALLGLGFFLFRRKGQPYRPLGWTFLVTLTLFVTARARFYYSFPLYPVLIAAGSVEWETWVQGLTPLRRQLAQALHWSGLALSAAAIGLLVLPVAPVGSKLWSLTAGRNDLFREELGWPDLAETVTGVYRSLPGSERARTGILAGNYGEAGALNLYGASHGLPRAMCGTNSFWYRGYDERLPQTVILVGFDLDEANRLFAACTVAARNTNRYGVKNEESVDHPEILLCRSLRQSWPAFWRTFRRFG